MADREIVWYPAGVDPLHPDGSEIMLEGDPASPFREVLGAGGFFVAPWQIHEASTPDVDGSSFVSVRREARDPQFRFQCSTVDHAVFAEAMAGLARALTQQRSPGTLVVTNRLGTGAAVSRMIRCLYSDGLQGDAMLSRNTRVKWWSFSLKFRAFDPAWYRPDDLHATWRGKSYTPFFHSGSFLPFVFTAALYGVDEDVELEVRGDADTWPSYDLVGPFSRVRVTNLRSQRLGNVQPDSFWELNRVTSDTELLRLVTKPGGESLRLYNFTLDGAGQRILDAGTNAWSTLSADSWFDPLQAQDALSVVADGTFTGTLVELWAQEAWLSHG